MAVSTQPSIAYDKRELNKIARVLRQMDETAVKETKRRVQELAQKELNEIRRVASSRGKVANRVAQGGKVKASSLLGEISFGFAGQSSGCWPRRLLRSSPCSRTGLDKAVYSS